MPSSVANRRLQSLSRNRAAPRTLVADEPGQGWFRVVALYARISGEHGWAGRPGVSIAAGILQKAGLIQYRRGEVKILSRKNLERATCECYLTIKQCEAASERNLG